MLSWACIPYGHGMENNMDWQDALKRANVNIHIMATGAAAGLQELLWEVPGSSAYLSGASFPYDGDEQAELLGFMPEHFCSEEAAVDLASAAYMKAYKFGGKRPVGVGITASVASTQIHRGDHRVFACVMTKDVVRSASILLKKGAGIEQRIQDGEAANSLGFLMMDDTIFGREGPNPLLGNAKVKDTSALALERFKLRPFFSTNGKRLEQMPKGRYALMSGAYNPPHEGHFGLAESAMEEFKYSTVFEITADPPHKEALKVQDMLERAKLLRGHNVLFTNGLPYYLDKARKYRNTPLIMGADAMVRMLDPKWGLDIGQMFSEFYDYGTKLLIGNREVNGVMTSCEDILNDIKAKFSFSVWASAQIIMKPLSGEWNISSTELRNKAI